MDERIAPPPSGLPVNVDIPMLPPGEVPTSVSVAALPNTSGGARVLLAVSTPAGTNYAILAPEVAEQIGQNMIRAAAQARTGLVIAPAPAPPAIPNGSGRRKQ